MSDTLKKIILVGIFTLPFLPFIVSTSLFFPFITAKGFVFRIIVEIIFACWLILAISDISYRPKKSPIFLSFLVFVAVIFVSDLFSANIVKSFWSNFERMEGWILLAHLFAYFLVLVSVLRDSKWWNYFWNTTLTASLIVSFVGFLQLAGRVAINQGNVRLDAYIGNATYLAVYLLIHIFLAVFLYVRTQSSSLWRWFYVVTIISNTIILYYTATRGALLGLVGGVFISALLIAIFEKERRLLRKISLAIVAGIIVFGGIFIVASDSSFVAKNSVLSRFKPNSLVGTAETRTSVWKIAIEGFKERPILGWGQESFNYVFNKYYNPALFGEEQWFDRTHSIIFDWLIAGGLLGLLSYLSILVLLVVTLWKIKHFSLVDKALLTGLVAAYFFQNLFVFDNLLSYFLFVSFLAYVHSEKVQASEEVSVGINDYQPEVKNNFNYATIPVVFVLLISLYTINIRPILANSSLIKSFIDLQETPTKPRDVSGAFVKLQKALAYNSPLGKIEIREQVAQTASSVLGLQGVNDKIKQDFFALGIKALEDQIQETPNDIRHYLLFASYLNSFGKHDEAIVILEKAQVMSPKKQIIYFELASSYVNKQDYKKAFEMFKRAYDLAPDFSEVKRLYAIGSIYAQENKLTKELFSQIDRVTVVTDNRFIHAYQVHRQYEEIIQIFKERVVLNPKSYENHISLAAAYMELNRPNDAIKEIEEAIKLNPDPNFKGQGEYYISEIRAGRKP